MLGTVHSSLVLLYGALVGALLLVLAAAVALPGNRPLAGWFWVVAQVVAALVILQAASGLGVYLGGGQPGRGLHLLYGVLSLAGALALVALRPGGRLRRRYADALAGREARVVGLVCLTEFGLLARAWMTGQGW
ncbi:MAG: hypothetical protein QN183_05745 [Armatimonadota bacterium]|nr:hypothetical protein [Armatimonadota bacterium]MDR7534701.1 hypothetical protein [Armatimonadota bacterium]MDR7535850.1 hypothetical protein [Armatimonadota bacterium]